MSGLFNNDYDYLFVNDYDNLFIGEYKKTPMYDVRQMITPYTNIDVTRERKPKRDFKRFKGMELEKVFQRDQKLLQHKKGWQGRGISWDILEKDRKQRRINDPYIQRIKTYYKLNF